MKTAESPKVTNFNQTWEKWAREQDGTTLSRKYIETKGFQIKLHRHPYLITFFEQSYQQYDIWVTEDDPEPAEDQGMYRVIVMDLETLEEAFHHVNRLIHRREQMFSP